MTLFKNKYRIESARYEHWDYRWVGAYFITICVDDYKNHYFGEIVDGKMELSNVGVIADLLWYGIKNRASNIRLGEFVVMPNHMHGILIVETLHATSVRGDGNDGKNSKNGNDEENLENGNNRGNLKNANDGRDLKNGNDGKNSKNANDEENLKNGNDGKNSKNGNDEENLENGNDGKNSKNGNDEENLENGNNRGNLKNANDEENLKNGNDGKNSKNANDGRDLKNGNDGKNSKNANDEENLENRNNRGNLKNGNDGRDLKNGNNRGNLKNANNTVQTLHATSPPIPTKKQKKSKFMANISPKSHSISTIIRSYKSAVTKHANRLDLKFKWHTRFHDHIIRDEQSFDNISNYIINNPANWGKDKFHK